MVFMEIDDVPEVTPKESVYRKASTFAQDVPTGHVHCWLKIEKITLVVVKITLCVEIDKP